MLTKELKSEMGIDFDGEKEEFVVVEDDVVEAKFVVVETDKNKENQISIKKR